MTYDLALKNAYIVDGTGSPGFMGQIGIKDGKIACIEKAGDIQAAKTITLEADEAVCPGFIDGHSHSDKYIFYDKFMKPKLLQGITTDLGGNCGIGAAPVAAPYEKELENYSSLCGVGLDLPKGWSSLDTFDKFLSAVEALEPEINIGFYIAHGVLRIAVKGYDQSPLTEAEMERMKALLCEALDAGAVGMSTGLIYAPGSYATQHELTELCKVLKSRGALYATHIRSQSDGVLEAIKEAFDLAYQTGVKLLISHHKIVGKANAKLIPETFKLYEKARADGLDVYLDSYPYESGASTLSILIPRKYLDGGVEKLVERLKDEKTRGQIASEILDSDGTWENIVEACGFDGIYVLSAPANPETLMKNLQEIAELWGMSRTDALFKLLVDNNGKVFCRLKFLTDENVEELIRYPDVIVASDAILAADGVVTHPRAYGTYPRILGCFVRDRGVLTLEEAVKKMTSMPAGLYGFGSKGRIEAGKDADLTIINRKTIIDRADYEDPRKPNEGVVYVIVGGKLVLDHGVLTEQRAGNVLRMGRNV